MHTERSNTSKKQNDNETYNHINIKIRPKSTYRLQETPQVASTLMQTESQMNFTSREPYNDSKPLEKMIIKNKFAERNLKVIKKKKTRQTSLNSSQETVNTKLLKKINSTMNFHHKKTQSIVPYLIPTYQKALKTMLKDYKQQIKESDIKTTRDTQVSLV